MRTVKKIIEQLSKLDQDEVLLIAYWDKDWCKDIFDNYEIELTDEIWNDICYKVEEQGYIDSESITDIAGEVAQKIENLRGVENE